LVGFNDRHGTRWKISAIPLGGYVKFFGDENAASVPDQDTIAAMNSDERRVSFFHQPVASRAAVVVAGPVANFLLAITIFASLFMIFGKQETPARVDEVVADSAAAAAGFQPGDMVLSINGKPIETFRQMQEIVAMSANETLDMVVERQGAKVTLRATPKVSTEKDSLGMALLGIKQTNGPGDVRTVRYSPLGAIAEAGRQTWGIVDQTVTYISRVLVGRASPAQIGGVVRIAQMSGQAASLGFPTLMNWAALISVSIGLLNLFPIPLLDGGHLLFYAIEAIRGRPLSERVQEFGFRIGFAIIVMLVIFTVWNDISHIGSS
jgi:regulator of sigma E protease